jgi:hypothetical protein
LTQPTIKKLDCVTLEEAAESLQVSKSTVSYYCKELGITIHRFQFDRKGYLAKSDLSALFKIKEEG